MIVTQTAMTARIRRALKKEGRYLRTCRNPLDQQGPIYIIDDENCFVAENCTVEGLMSELGLLRDGEALEGAK